jgi:hypothetical protein
MKKALLLAAATAAAFAALPASAAEEFGTPKEAESMVKAAVAHLAKVGK